MLKLVKYELRANLFTLLGICLTVIVADLLLLTRRGAWPMPVIVGISTSISVSAVITIFIYSLATMGKYLYEDKGYLLFTLPQSGISILASRLLSSLAMISLVLIVSGLSNFIVFNEKVDFSGIMKFVKPEYLYTSIIFILSSIVYFLTFIYFCMVIGKVALKKKKLGKLGSFVVFIVVSIILSWISSKANDIFPQSFTLWDYPVGFNFNTSASDINISANVTNGCSINIAETIIDILTFAVFFFSSSYLLEKKIEL